MYALTTFDNPYDPFTDYFNWFMFDCQKGYNSSEYLARIAMTHSEMSEDEYDLAIEEAIDEIVKYDPFNIYKKVKRAA